MVYGQYEAALLFSDRHKAGARKMENRWGLIAKPTLKTMQRKPTSKTYNTEVGKAETFSFTATQITDGDDVIHTAHAVTIPTISFGTTDLGTTTKTAKINLVGTDFPEAHHRSL